MVIYLYYKRHQITGLNYFGKTINNPYTYNGSGTRWKRHLNKHGFHINTIQVWKFESQEECSEFAINFSRENHIVESKDWANLVIENGHDGRDAVKASWEQRDKKEFAQTISNIWADRDETIKKTIFGKVAQTLLNKTKEQRAKIRKKRKLTEDGKPKIICPHCSHVSKDPIFMENKHFDHCYKLSVIHKKVETIKCPFCSKIGSFAPNMRRYHFDNCKYNPNRLPKTKITCPHCGVSSEGAGAMKTKHFDNCKLKFGTKEIKCPFCNDTFESISHIQWCDKNPDRKIKQVLECPHCHHKSKSTSMMSKNHFDNCLLIKPRDKIKCPYCNVQSYHETNMKRWHFDNCKSQPL